MRYFTFIMILLILWTVMIPRAVFAVAAAPAMIELSGPRRKTVSGIFQVINTQDLERTYYLRSIKFASKGETGEPQFISWDKDHAGLPEWIHFSSNTITVPAHDQHPVSFTVSIPSDTPSGGYYAAIVVSSSPATVVATNGASIEANVAILLLLTVEGDTNQHIALLDFHSQDNESISDRPASSYVYRIQNQGNVHVQPTGTVTMKDVFGRTVVSVPANTEGGRILPGTTRSFAGSVGVQSPLNFFQAVQEQVRHLAIGPMRVELRLDNGSGEPIKGVFGFWLIPWQALITLIAAAMIVVGVPRLMTKRRS